MLQMPPRIGTAFAFLPVDRAARSSCSQRWRWSRLGSSLRSLRPQDKDSLSRQSRSRLLD